MILTVASLCSGYEATGLGLALAGWDHRLAFVADPDPAASTVLAHQHPDVPNLGDITRVAWDDLGLTGQIDLLTAGFPCTDVSCAGRRAGLGAGTRSGVWSNVADAIDVLRPRMVLIENVSALLSTHANRSTDGAAADSDVEPGPAGVGDGADRPLLRAIGAVLGDLSDLGYDAVWITVSAASVGAPHLRKRVFILAWPAADARSWWGNWLHERKQPGHLATIARDGGARLSTDKGRQAQQERELSLLPTPNAALGRSTGMPSEGTARRRMHDEVRRFLDDAVALLPTPTVADARGSRNATAGRGVDASSEWSPGWSLSDVAYADRWGEYAPAIARWEHVTGRPAPDPTEPGKNGQPRLSARFVEWLQGLPDGYVTAVPGISRNDALRLLGNANPPQQYAAAVTQLAAIVAAVFAGEVAA